MPESMQKNEAIICHGRRVTYRDLDEQVTRLGHALLEQGVRQGDKVLIFMPNVVEFVVSYFAIQRIGAIVVPVNAKLTLPEVEYVAQHAEARAIIAHEAIFTSVENITLVSIKIKTGQVMDGWLNYEMLIQNASTIQLIASSTKMMHLRFYILPVQQVSLKACSLATAIF